jgi:alkaline phosphatase
MSKKHVSSLVAALFSLSLGAAAHAAESIPLDFNALPNTPNENKRASILATYQLPATDIATLNPGIDLGDAASAVKNGYTNRNIPGIGSALVAIPGKPGEFYMMTDRGVNYDNVNGSGKMFGKNFPLPNFTPAIVHVKLDQGSIKVIKSIPIVDSLGKSVTGLSNNKDDETPYLNNSSSALPFNPAGLDTEALQLLPDGNFLVSEEYGPSMAVVSAKGEVLVRYVPMGKAYPGVNYPVKAILPAIYKERRSNRGFENVSVTPDGKTAYVTLQSPMGNAKDKDYENSRLIRVLRLDITQPIDAKVTGMFVLLQSEKSAYPETDKQKDLKFSDAVAFEQDKLLFLERANKKFKLRVADLSAATNVLDNPQAATLVLEKEAENLDKLAIKPVAMREVFDSRDVFLQIDTDKLEGLALLNSSVVAISNDNDFGVGENTTGYPSKVWVIRLGKALINP